MFGKKETAQDAPTINNGKVDTIIGKGTEFKGDIKAQGLLRVEGKLEGKIDTQGDIIIGESGLVHADVSGRHMTIAGEMRGNIDITGKLELTPTAKLFGDVKVNSLAINDGAVFRGSCEMKKAAVEKPVLQDENKDLTQS
jgi:cytoskeletal protein CcmA (bactofilin family)